MTTNDTVKGLIFGAIGGAVGTYFMSYYWKAAEALHGHNPLMLTNEGEPHELDSVSVAGDQTKEGEGSTAALGRIAHETATGEEPPPARKQQLSEGVHWSYGIGVAALYGAVRGRRSIPDAAGGAAFGTLIWALGDEGMVPMLGLSGGPTAYPAEQHVHRLGAHVFYGLVAAAATQSLFGLFAPKPPKRELVWDAAKTYATWKGVKTGTRALWKVGKAVALYKAFGKERRRFRAIGKTANSARKAVRTASKGSGGFARAAIRAVT